jgi:hypothetical protein
MEWTEDGFMAKGNTQRVESPDPEQVASFADIAESLDIRRLRQSRPYLWASLCPN